MTVPEPMTCEIDFWKFVKTQVQSQMSMVILVVADSNGSSPGRAGYKMAVAADGELMGSIGGGVMEVALVDRAKAMLTLSEPEALAGGHFATETIEQVHRKHSPDASGMICSGSQTVLIKLLGINDLPTVEAIIEALSEHAALTVEISNFTFQISDDDSAENPIRFERADDGEFFYRERVGQQPRLFIIGGGHCALALSELARKLGFRISLFDDRPDLNTIAKNDFAESVTIIDSYANIAEHVPNGDDVYVAVMTLGYISDAVVIRKLIDHDVKYFGVLGSKAKMAALMRELRDEGINENNLARIRAPIGVQFNSRTPEEIAVSIAAEMITVKNMSEPPRVSGRPVRQ